MSPSPMRLSILLIACALFSIIGVQGQSYNYCDVLKKSLLFYEAQRSGRLPTSNRVPWRGNSALGDCTSVACTLLAQGDGNLEGGYYDAGDGVKFMFPAAFSTTTLAWGFIEFQSAIYACGETQNYLDAIKWSTDFMIKAHTSELEFWGQIGNGGIDHSWWGPPEKMSMSRPTYKISSSNPGTELALEAASALAAASMAFKSFNPTYSALCLTHARQLYKLGYNYRGFYHDAIPDAGNYYHSYGYNDEIVWGSTWLYRATGESAYLVAAKSDYVTFNMKFNAPGQSFDWDQKAPGVLVNMWKATGDSQYLADAQTWMNSWYPGNGMTYTPGGLAWLREWGPLRYTSGSAFLALLIGDSRSNTWARGQIDYMLGSNPSKRSYVCGFGNNPPINPHHRAAHGSTTFNINDPVNNKNILTGALVGGPDKNDYYVDDRTDYVKNEVALDYNAAFTGALAGLAKLLGLSVGQTTTVAPTSPPTTTTTTTTPKPTTTTTTTTTPRPTTTTTTTPVPTTTTTTPKPTTTTPRPSTTTPRPTTTKPPKTTTTTTKAPPISQATTRPTTDAPDSSDSSDGTSAGKISVQLHSGSSSWWFAIAVLNAGPTTTTVEFTDGGQYSSFTAMLPTNWGYFIFSPSSELKAPISLRLTSDTGAMVTLPNVYTAFNQYTAVQTTQQYGAAASRSIESEDEAFARAIADTPDNAHTLKMKVHQGSSVWWLAVAPFDATQITLAVNVKDSAGNTSLMRNGGWGFWILETQGTPLTLPLTITSTSASGSDVSFTITDFATDLMIDSNTQY